MKFKSTERSKDKTLPYFLGIAFLFLVIKLFELKLKFSDGFTYMYMGKLLLQGLIPYKDFFFASPPLQIYLISFGEIFVENHLLLLKLIPIFATIGSSFFIYSLMKNKFNGLQAITAATLFLFSFLTLLTTDYSTGIHLTLFFILGMIYFIEEDKPLLAGIFGSLALSTRLYALFPIAGAGIYYLICKRKSIWSFLIGLASVFISLSIIFQILSRGAYLDQIFFFRLHLISGIGLSKSEILSFFIKGDFLLILGTFLYFLLDNEKKKLLLPILATAFSLILYIVYSDIYYLYFALIIGFLAIFTTKFIFTFEDQKNFKMILGIFLSIFILFNSFFYIIDYGSSSNINFTNDLVEFVKENSSENQTIYGSFEITPLIGILAHRKLAGNIADTNPKNIMTNTFTIGDIEKKIEGVKFIIVKGNILNDGSIVGFDASTPINYIRENCKIEKTYSLKEDFTSNVVVVYDCEN